MNDDDLFTLLRVGKQWVGPKLLPADLTRQSKYISVMPNVGVK